MPKHATFRPEALYFEDFSEGQRFAVVTKGPMMVGHQVRWAGATDNYDFEFHHDELVAKEHGLPGIILSGSFMGSYLLTAVTHWLGCKARVVKYADRSLGYTAPRDLAHLTGTVSRAFREDGRCFVEVDCRIENQRGEVTTTGKALAVVPERAESAA